MTRKYIPITLSILKEVLYRVSYGAASHVES
jgi:hypothetical protein